MFYECEISQKLTMFILYVNDMIIIYNDIEEIDMLKQKLLT